MKLQEKFRDPKVRRWIFLLALVLLFAAVTFIIEGDEPRQYPKYVSDSPSPTGLKGFDQYLKRHFQSVGAWKDGVNQLPDLHTKQLMIMVGPYQTLDPPQVSGWKKWIEKGNDLLLAARQPQSFGIQSHMIKNWLPKQEDRIIGEQSLNGNYIGTVSSSWRLNENRGDRVLLKDDKGILAFSRSYGKGQLIVLLTPDWFTNGHILAHDHLKMILPLINHARPQRVWINEKIHGSRSMPSMLSVYPRWLLFMFGDLLLLITLWLWYKGKQFGPVEMPREWAVRFGDERLQAAAAWYRRGKFYHEAIHTQAEYLRHLIQEKWGVSAHVEVNEMLLSVERRLPDERTRIWKSNWQEIEEITNHGKALNQKSFIEWTRVIDEMRIEVEAS